MWLDLTYSKGCLFIHPDAAGERYSTAFQAGIGVLALKVNILGPVLVVMHPTALKLREWNRKGDPGISACLHRAPGVHRAVQTGVSWVFTHRPEDFKNLIREEAATVSLWWKQRAKMESFPKLTHGEISPCSQLPWWKSQLLPWTHRNKWRLFSFLWCEEQGKYSPQHRAWQTAMGSWLTGTWL